MREYIKDVFVSERVFEIFDEAERKKKKESKEKRLKLRQN